MEVRVDEKVRIEDFRCDTPVIRITAYHSGCDTPVIRCDTPVIRVSQRITACYRFL